MRSTAEAIAWYRSNEVYPGELDFDPDGMCQKICRTARDIGPVYPSALSAQQATPGEYRVTKIRDIRKGMVGFFDDPNDSNPYGHIVTWVARIKGADPDSLSSLLCRTNSVKANEIVVVRGDYFGRYWGDEYQFSATWLNGQAFPEFIKPDKPKPEPRAGNNVKHAIEDLEKAIAWHKKHNHDRLVRALQRDVARLRNRL